MSAAETDYVALELPELGIQISKFITYTATSHFTTPCDSFEFTLSADVTPANVRSALRRGEFCRVSVNGRAQAEGYIDRVTTQASRGSGTLIHVEGADKLAQACRAGIDPRKRFSSGSTLLDVMAQVFAPFHFPEIIASNDANRNIITGLNAGETKAVASADLAKAQKALLELQRANTRTLSANGGVTVASQIRQYNIEQDIAKAQARIDAVTSQPSVLKQKVSKKGKRIKSFVVHQTKPYPGETCFAFASRLAQRFGLWIWLSVEGDLIVSQPDFDQAPSYTLLNGPGTASNVLDASAREDSSNQPSIIVATGFSYGGEADRSALKVICLNDLVASDEDGILPAVEAVVRENPDAKVVADRPVFPASALRNHPAVQPIYLHDQESQTLEQLENFALRELALRQKDALHLNYVVEGHTQGGVVWAVDTIVDVQDDYLDIHEPMYVLSRRFEKGSSGTRTVLELIRPHTLVFGD